MSAPHPAILAPIIAPFMYAMVSIDRLPPNNLVHLLQRGVSAIVHAFAMAFICTGHMDTGLASAQVTADRFQQFIAQATIEKLDTSLLCEAFVFALRGTTYGRVLDDTPALTLGQKKTLFKAYADHQRFTDRLHELVEQSEAGDVSLSLEPILAFAETIAQGVV